MEISREHSRAFKNSSYGTILNIITVLGSFVIGSLIARFLGSANYGIYAAAIGLWITPTVVLSGPLQSVSYFVAKLDDPFQRRAVVKKALTIIIISDFIVSVALISLFSTLSSIYHLDFASYYIILAAFWIYSFRQFEWNILVGAGKIKETLFQGSLFEIARVIQIFLIVLLADRVFGALLGYAIAYFLSLLTIFIPAREYIFGKSEKISKEIYSEFKSVLKNSYLSSLLGVMPTTAFISLILGSVAVEYAGYYRASTIISNLISAIGGGIIMGSFNVFVGLYKSKDTERISSIQKLLARYAILIVVPLWFIFNFFSHDIIIILFKAQFLVINNVILLLTTAAVISQVLAVYNVLSAIGRYDLIFRVALIGDIVFIAFLPLFYIGAIGSAIDYFLYSIITTGLSVYISNKYIKFRFPWKTLLFSLLNSVLMVIIILLLHNIGFHGFSFIIAVLIGIGLYSMISIIFKQVDLKELRGLLARSAFKIEENGKGGS